MENKIIYGDYMRDNLNSLIRRLLSGITNYLVRVREGGRVPIPTPRRNVQQYRPVPARQNEETAASSSTKDKNW